MSASEVAGWAALSALAIVGVSAVVRQEKRRASVLVVSPEVASSALGTAILASIRRNAEAPQ